MQLARVCKKSTLGALIVKELEAYRQTRMEFQFLLEMLTEQRDLLNAINANNIEKTLSADEKHVFRMNC